MSLHDDLLSLCDLARPTCEIQYEYETHVELDRLGHDRSTTANFAVVKTGDPREIVREMEYVRALGNLVGPMIYGEFRGGYVMEYLRGPRLSSTLLLQVGRLLREQVWCRLAFTTDYQTFREKFFERFGGQVPDWVDDEEWVLTHGDPTIANVRSLSGGEIRLIDPKPPGRGIPSFRSVDRGKMIQSMMGWEMILTGRSFQRQESPLQGLSELDLRRSIWWAGVHLLRISQRSAEGTRPGDWSRRWASELLELAS